MTDVLLPPEQEPLGPENDSTHSAPIRPADAVNAYLSGMIDVIGRVDPNQLAECFHILWAAWQEDRVIFLVGNGGSASTASHMANDLSKQAQVGGRKPLRALAL